MDISPSKVARARKAIDFLSSLTSDDAGPSGTQSREEREAENERKSCLVIS